NTSITSVTLNQTGLRVKGGDSNALDFKPNETMTAARILNFKVNDADRTLDLGGNFATTGGQITLTATATTSVTLPTTGTLATLAGTETLTNKRVNPRSNDNNAPSSPVTPDTDSYDFIDYRAIGAALTVNVPSGTPVSGQKLVLRFKDDGTARALTLTTGANGF